MKSKQHLFGEHIREVITAFKDMKGIKMKEKTEVEDIKVTIEIEGQTLKLTLEKAEKLYNTLKELFGGKLEEVKEVMKKEKEYVPCFPCYPCKYPDHPYKDYWYPYEPYYPYYPYTAPWYITTTDGTSTNWDSKDYILTVTI